MRRREIEALAAAIVDELEKRGILSVHDRSVQRWDREIPNQCSIKSKTSTGSMDPTATESDSEFDSYFEMVLGDIAASTPRKQP